MWESMREFFKIGFGKYCHSFRTPIWGILRLTYSTQKLLFLRTSQPEKKMHEILPSLFVKIRIKEPFCLLRLSWRHPLQMYQRPFGVKRSFYQTLQIFVTESKNCPLLTSLLFSKRPLESEGGKTSFKGPKYLKTNKRQLLLIPNTYMCIEGGLIFKK